MNYLQVLAGACAVVANAIADDEFALNHSDRVRQFKLMLCNACSTYAQHVEEAGKFPPTILATSTLRTILCMAHQVLPDIERRQDIAIMLRDLQELYHDNNT